jgi:hypothetical protein
MMRLFALGLATCSLFLSWQEAQGAAPPAPNASLVELDGGNHSNGDAARAGSSEMASVDFDLARLPSGEPIAGGPALAGNLIAQQSKRATWKQAKSREIMFQVLNVVDFIQTARCLSHNECTEQNPLIGRKPSIARLAAFKVTSGVLHFGVTRFMLKDTPQMMNIWLNASLAIQGGAVVYNLNTVF